ncbi:MAG: NERD domain-containing protein [Chloroflexota bacterium]|nr:NERD domain-containing protein [Chloroflexota bacterium]MDE2961002.1 NERD domain-containing protein [Chloroflexota bacterium]
MATMMPRIIPDDAPNSERLVFQLLREDSVTDGWIVIHKIRPRQRPGRRPREIDFLVLIPNVALLCIEVKGGGFVIESGSWYRPGPPRESIEPPVDQAETAMFLMRNELVSQFRGQWDDGELPIGCVVVFTDTNWPEGIREPGRPVVGLPDLQQQGARTLAQRLAEIAQTIRGEIAPLRRLSFDLPTAQSIAEYLLPTSIVLVPVPRPIPYRNAERLLISLTEEQYQAFAAVDENNRVLFHGAAGTGKTMLASELAKGRAAAGDQVALVCYNRILGDWLVNESMEHFALGDVTGSFWHHFAYTIIGRDQSLWQQFSTAMHNAADNNERYEEICPAYARDSLLQSGPMFDYLIVDELQDMCQDPYLEVMDLALRGGLQGGRWAMFADFNQQLMNWGRNPDSNIANLNQYLGNGQYAERTLVVNCRNTLPIITDAGNISGIDLPEIYQNTVNGPLPSYEFWRNDTDLRIQIDRTVRGLINNGEQISNIFVLGTSALEQSGLDLLNHAYAGYELFDCPGIYWPPRRECDQSPCCQISLDNDTYLKFREVRRFKGMESRGVILIVDRMNLPDDRAALYVGMTRARINLIVLAHESARDNLIRLVDRSI